MQVGSKNAAFFMGKCIKIATRSAGGTSVHELEIAAAELEARYKAQREAPFDSESEQVKVSPLLCI